MITIGSKLFFVKKSYNNNYFSFFQKLRALWSESEKMKFLFQFLTSFSLLDIYKCPKSVFESKTWKSFYVLVNHPYLTFILYL
jgi:hypothetical protein